MKPRCRKDLTTLPATRQGKVVRVKRVSPLQVRSRLRWHRRSSAFIILWSVAKITAFKIKADKQNFFDTNCFRKSNTTLRQTPQEQTHRKRKRSSMTDQTGPALLGDAFRDHHNKCNGNVTTQRFFRLCCANVILTRHLSFKHDTFSYFNSISTQIRDNLWPIHPFQWF